MIGDNGSVVGFANYAGTYARTYDADNRLLTGKLNGATQITHTYVDFTFQNVRYYT